MKAFHKLVVNSALLIFFTISNSLFAKEIDTLVIKTTIYCDHCKECESCGAKIERDLTFDKGIEAVQLDEKAMTIKVTYNSKKTNPEAIRQLISKYGFDADEVKADPIAYSKLDECCKK
ncbi:MAG: cation transporter [Bacteroidota bacterium]